ncbi:MAG: class I SAM-dependent methyltransferase [Planctomycetaceae bacterium]
MSTHALPFRLAAPGYVPQRVWWKDFALRLLGNPNLIKRLQMPDIFAALDLKPHETALDFGCGSGYMTYEMARRCRKAYGIDVINVADNLIPHSLEGRLEFRVSRGERTPFESGMFDVILMSEVVPMIPDPRLFFEEVTRILKPGGRIVLVNPLERRAIRRDYDQNGILVRLMRKLGRAPRDYDDFTEKLQTSFGTALKKLPEEQYYRDVLDSVGYSIVDTKFTPAAAAQEFYERMQFVALCTNRPTFSNRHFALYPLLKALNFLGRRRRGTGCVMVARPKAA